MSSCQQDSNCRHSAHIAQPARQLPEATSSLAGDVALLEAQRLSASARASAGSGRLSIPSAVDVSGQPRWISAESRRTRSRGPPACVGSGYLSPVLVQMALGCLLYFVQDNLGILLHSGKDLRITGREGIIDLAVSR